MPTLCNCELAPPGEADMILELGLKLKQTFCDGIAHVAARRLAANVKGADLPGGQDVFGGLLHKFGGAVFT